MVPTKPKRPCSYPGCPKLTDGRFCEEHAKAEAKRYEKYDRDPAVRRRYGRAWKRIRDRYIQEHPLCELCQRDGRLTPAEEVHHKVPLSEGGTHARDNLVALCKSCHARIHAQRGDRWHRKMETTPKGSLQYGGAGRIRTCYGHLLRFLTFPLRSPQLQRGHSVRAAYHRVIPVYHREFPL